MPNDDESIYFLAPTVFWFTNRGWRVGSGHPSCKSRRGRPIAESDVIEALSGKGLDETEIELVLRSEKLRHRARQLIRAAKLLERVE